MNTINGWPTEIKFKIKNMGKSPIRIEEGKTKFIYTGSGYNKIARFFMNSGNDINFILTSESQYFLQRSFLPRDSTQAEAFIEQLESGQKGLYLCGTYVYKNLLNGKRKQYEFVIHILSNDNVYLWNENYETVRRHTSIPILKGY